MESKTLEPLDLSMNERKRTLFNTEKETNRGFKLISNYQRLERLTYRGFRMLSENCKDDRLTPNGEGRWDPTCEVMAV